MKKRGVSSQRKPSRLERLLVTYPLLRIGTPSPTCYVTLQLPCCGTRLLPLLRLLLTLAANDTNSSAGRKFRRRPHCSAHHKPNLSTASSANLNLWVESFEADLEFGSHTSFSIAHLGLKIHANRP
jgi:hypothetical protein